MKKSMKQLFEEKKKLVVKTNEIGRQLDKIIVEKWGFHYSETDDDSMIDTLDYGISGISFDNFKKRMDAYKEERREDGSFVAIP